MKTAIVKIAAVVLTSMTTFLPALSQSASTFNGTGEKPEVKYMGMLKQDPLFALNLNNPTIGEFVITVKNAEGVALHTEKVKGANLSRKYRIDILDELSLESFYIRIEVLNVATNTSSTYNVTSQTQVTDNFFIAKL